MTRGLLSIAPVAALVLAGAVPGSAAAGEAGGPAEAQARVRVLLSDFGAEREELAVLLARWETARRTVEEARARPVAPERAARIL
ncbi:MAG: hypothetical protein D6729_08780, partial [Deltaproteobacteria bacterium]